MDNDLPVNDNNLSTNDSANNQAAGDDVPVTPSTQVSPGIGSGIGLEGAPLTENLPTPEKVSIPEKINTPVEQLPSTEAIQQNQIAPETPVVPEVPQPESAPEVAPDLNVVDKRTSHEKLTTIKSASDQLTVSADEEEEDFIKHVEEVHTIK